jgi:hypothetical protein
MLVANTMNSCRICNLTLFYILEYWQMPTWCETFICVDEDEIFDIDEADDGKLEMQADVWHWNLKLMLKIIVYV